MAEHIGIIYCLKDPRNFEIRYNDLEFDKQEELVGEVKNSLLDSYESEMSIDKEKKWYVTPKTWQEEYCRVYDIDYSDWNDLDEKCKEFQEFDWKYALEEHAEDEAKLKVVTAFKYVSVEVEI